MKIVTIGDIHGRSNWRSHIKEHQDADKFVFVGDYADSFDKSNSEIIKELKDIISFKRENNDKVELLLGNHDMHYIVDNHNCDGLRPEMKPILNDIYMSNIDLFKLTYQIDNIIWSHAGITQVYLDTVLALYRTEAYRFYNITKDLETISDLCNFLWKANKINSDLHLVGAASKGISDTPSMIWARPTDHRRSPLVGYTQIVGHTVFDELSYETNAEAKSMYIYVDVLSTSNEVYKFTL